MNAKRKALNYTEILSIIYLSSYKEKFLAVWVKILISMLYETIIFTNKLNYISFTVSLSSGNMFLISWLILQQTSCYSIKALFTQPQCNKEVVWALLMSSLLSFNCFAASNLPHLFQ